MHPYVARLRFKGGISGVVESGGGKLRGNREGRLRNVTEDLKTHNELSVTQDSLFPSMGTTTSSSIPPV